jgi:hypothetical protein
MHASQVGLSFPFIQRMAEVFGGMEGMAAGAGNIVSDTMCIVALKEKTRPERIDLPEGEGRWNKKSREARRVGLALRRPRTLGDQLPASKFPA